MTSHRIDAVFAVVDAEVDLHPLLVPVKVDVGPPGMKHRQKNANEMDVAIYTKSNPLARS